MIRQINTAIQYLMGEDTIIISYSIFDEYGERLHYYNHEVCTAYDLKKQTEELMKMNIPFKLSLVIK
jgi:hypothetical protein